MNQGPVLHRHLIAAVASIAALIVIAGCGDDSSTDRTSASSTPTRVKVVATTTIVGDLVGNVGGGAADVTQILKPNTDAHDYEPRPDDVVRTTDAALVVQSGDGLDTWMSDVVKQSDSDADLLDVSQVLKVRLPGEKEGEEASEYDPHWWHDPRNAETAVGEIRDALSTANPAAAATYERNASAYIAKVRALDEGIAACFADIPTAERKLVTDHDAFGYFARRYGLRVVGAVIPSQTTQAQASAGDVANLSRVIEQEEVKAIFPERALNPKLARALAEQTGATAEYTLYGDSLGEQGSTGATYLGMQEANADAIVKGLTGGASSCEVEGI